MEKELIPKTDLQKNLVENQKINPTNGSPIEFIQSGKIWYAKLFIKDGKVYAVAQGQEVTEELGLVHIKKLKSAPEPDDRIIITKVNCYAAMGEIIKKPD